MNKTSLRIFLLAGWCCFSTAPVQADVTPKPRSPVSVNIVPDTAVGATSVGFTVTASSLLPADEFIITIQPPAGATLEQGELFWRGALQQNATKTLHFTLQLPDAGVLRAMATITDAGAPHYAASSIYRFGNSDGIRAKSVAQGVRSESRYGRGVVNFPLK